MPRRTAYRAALALAALAVLLPVWIGGAVGIVGAEGDRADLVFAAALGVAVVGAAVARLRPRGMARAMAAAALAMALAGVVAVVAGLVPAYNSAFEVLGLSALFASPFGASAWLFARAAAAPEPTA